jgi:hypothetical protein
MHLVGSLNPTEFHREVKGAGEGEGVDLTVWERHGLPQSAQIRLRTASVDSAKLVWEVASACACASSTLRSCTPQSPHRRDSPAIACLLLASDRRNLGVGGKSRKVLLAKRFGATLGALKSSASKIPAVLRFYGEKESSPVGLVKLAHLTGSLAGTIFLNYTIWYTEYKLYRYGVKIFPSSQCPEIHRPRATKTLDPH